jgi:sugar transferase (PEP-CTERM/EpsH1 system associated)
MATAFESHPNADGRPLIAHAIFRLGVGGMENGLVNLVNRLPRDRYRHAIICLTDSSDFEKRIDADNVAVYELHKRDGKDPQLYLRFWRLIRKLKPSILHTRNLGALDLVPLAMLARVPVRIHGEHGWDASDPMGRSFKYRLLRRFCDLAVTEYVAVSRDIVDWLVEVVGIPQDKIKQIYNGVDVEIFCPDGTESSLPFDEQPKGLLNIGTVGRMDPIKNFDCLLLAIRKILEQQPSFRSRLRLSMVGSGSMLSAYRQKVAELGLQDIAWLPGERDDIPGLLRSMVIFVLPSRNEGISNTILESMATGLPIIASNVGGNSELIEDGVSGLLVEPNDSDALADALVFYLHHSEVCDSHGKAARERAVSLFSLRTMVQAYTQLYDRLLTSNASTRIH